MGNATATAVPSAEAAEGLLPGGSLLGAVLIAIGIFLVFMAAYYLPLFIRHRKVTREKPGKYIGAFFLGFAAMIASAVVQAGFAIIKPIQAAEGVPGVIFGIFWIMLSVAVTEELLKFFAGRLITDKMPQLNEAGCMMLFGTVGLGFETLETIGAGLASPLTVILRCITALHLVMQLYMGKLWWRAGQAKQAGNIQLFLKERRKALLIPVLIHTVFDYPILKISKLSDSADLSIGVVLGTIIGAVLFAVVCVILILISANRTLKAEKTAQETAAAQREHKLHILSRVAEGLNSAGVTWCVGASLLLYFRGRTEDFHDIDIMVATEDADKAEQVLNGFAQPRPAEPVPQFGTKRFIEYSIEGVDIDMIAGFSIIQQGREYDCALQPDQIEDTVTVEGQPVPLQALGCWKRFYRLMGRNARADLLKDIEER